MKQKNFAVAGNLAAVTRAYFWSEVIGQEVAKNVLLGQLAKGKLGNAYMLSGVAGIGKTTLLRILATVANCLHPDLKTFEPCGECEVCKGMMQPKPKCPDYQEIDCASNGLVADARNIQSFAAARPLHSFRFVVFDEAQEMSAAAQDVLLKPFENPQPYLINGIATTNESKIKETVASRCIKLRLTPPTDKQNISLLRALVKESGIPLDPDAYKIIVEACANKTRDCVNTLGMILDAASAPDVKSLLNNGGTAKFVSDLIGQSPWVLVDKAFAGLVSGDFTAIVDTMHAAQNKVMFTKSLLQAMTNAVVNIYGSNSYKSKLDQFLKHVNAQNLLVDTCDELSIRVSSVCRYEIDAEGACLPVLLKATRQFRKLGADSDA